MATRYKASNKPYCTVTWYLKHAYPKIPTPRMAIMDDVRNSEISAETETKDEPWREKKRGGGGKEEEERKNDRENAHELVLVRACTKNGGFFC